MTQRETDREVLAAIADLLRVAAVAIESGERVRAGELVGAAALALGEAGLNGSTGPIRFKFSLRSGARGSVTRTVLIERVPAARAGKAQAAPAGGALH
jgi:hypothetical protein